jgi:hypothetical protein
MKKITFLFLFLYAGLFHLQAQKVIGVYKGFMEVDSPKNTINFELTLKEKKGKLTGYCYRLFVLGDTLYYNLLKVNARISNDVLIVEDEYSVSNNFENNTRGIKTVFFFNLKDIRDTSTVLPGKWNTSAWRNYKPLTGVVNVIREKDYLSTQLYKRLADKKLDQEMVFEEPAIENPEAIAKKEKNKPNSDKTPVIASSKSENPQKVNNEQPTTTSSKTNPPTQEKKVLTAGKNNEENKVAINEKETAVSAQSAGEDKVSNSKEKPIVNKQQQDDKNKTAVNTNTPENKSAGAEGKPISVTPSDNNVGVIEKNSTITNKTDSITTQRKELLMAQNNDSIRRDYTGIKETVSQAKMQTQEFKRASDLIQTLSVFEDSITVALYDNGEIDGDTVSVFVNEKLLLNKVGLGAKAQKFTIYVPVGQMVQVSLFAETLGTIPPNTGLMVVYSGEQRYQVFFTSTLEKSASILFRRL